MAPKPTVSSHPYTCNTCQVAFKGSNLQRGHMQSDWHRYNLKRRVASLPPLTSEIFAEKVLANQASAAATAARASFEKVCAACARTYFSENAYQNHLQSQKHKVRLLQLAHGLDVSTDAGDTESVVSSTYSLGQSGVLINPPDHENIEDVDTDSRDEITNVTDSVNEAHLGESEPIEVTSAAQQGQIPSIDLATSTPINPTLQCLFCNVSSADIPMNVLHMSKSHGLFIPEQSYLIDLAGLLTYLHDRVHALHECLYCGQLKYTTSGIQTHMRDKGHCMIAFESEAEMVEVGEFYDFTGTYSDDDDDEETSDADLPDVERHGVKLGDMRDESDVGEEDEDWEEASDSEDEDDDRTVRNKRQAQVVDGELRLPSGRTAGHRSLARYYRQNLHNYPSASERAAQQQESRQRLIEAQEAGLDPDLEQAESDRRMQRAHLSRAVASRANGGQGLLTAHESVRKAAAKMEVKERRREQRALSKFKAGNERQNNNQKHFRDPLLQ